MAQLENDPGLSVYEADQLWNTYLFHSLGLDELKARDVAKGIIISVADNGVGITPEDQKRIFERFYQVRPNHLAGHGGMGIGLTIVKHLVELHEGELWVESEAGKGSTFSFLLPKKQTTGLPEIVPVMANTDQYQDEKLLEGA